MTIDDPVEQAATQQRALQLDTKLLRVGVILGGVGGVLAFVGMTVGGLALVGAARQWARQLDRPPRELARLKWQQALAASTAGADAWRQGPPARTSDTYPPTSPNVNPKLA